MGTGLRVPQDLALFGFNGLDLGQELPLPLSTIRSNRFNIGQRAVAVILGHPVRPGLPEVIDTGFEIIEGATA